MSLRVSAFRLLLTLFLLLFSLSTLASESFSLSLDTSEGGEISERRIQNLIKYLNQHQCRIQKIKVAASSVNDTRADFIFSPLERHFVKQYKKLASIRVVNDEPLSASILVRSSTGITDIRDLEGVRIAFLSAQSMTGFGLQQAMFKKLGIIHNKDRITITQTNVAAISLLLHKDVFAAGIATPLANKWAAANNLNIVVVSEEVQTGGIWGNQKLSSEILKKCQMAFVRLSGKIAEEKKLLKIFPGWLNGFF